MIVDPSRGSLFEVPIDTIVGFNHRILHTAPGDVEPTLASVNDADEPDQATAVVVAEDGSVLTATYADDLASGYGKIDAISALFAATSVSNDFFLTTAWTTVMESEWVLHFPTRRFYVDTLIDPQTGARFVSAEREPFPGQAGTGESCPYPIHWRGFDRSGSQRFALTWDRADAPIWVRRNPFCWQTISFGFGPQGSPPPQTPILRAPFEALYLESAQGQGRLQLGIDSEDTNSIRLRAPLEGVRFRGVPVTGFFVTLFDNDLIEGVPPASYAAGFRHHIRQETVPD